MKKVILALFVVGAMCVSSTVIAQDNTKKEGTCCKEKAKTETCCKKEEGKACCDKKETADAKTTCCADKKEKTASADAKACCAKKEATADSKSAGKK